MSYSCTHLFPSMPLITNVPPATNLSTQVTTRQAGAVPHGNWPKSLAVPSKCVHKECVSSNSPLSDSRICHPRGSGTQRPFIYSYSVYLKRRDLAVSPCKNKYTVCHGGPRRHQRDRSGLVICMAQPVKLSVSGAPPGSSEGRKAAENPLGLSMQASQIHNYIVGWHAPNHYSHSPITSSAHAASPV